MGADRVRRVAIVTGAAQRIGRHIACTLAQNGWDLAVHYRHSVEEASETLHQLHEIGGRHCVVKADLASETEVRELFARSVAVHKKIDAVINNASVFDYDDADSFDSAMLHKHMMPNLAAPIVLAQELHRHVSRLGPDARGVVINLLDQKLSNLNPDFLSYTLTKSALKTATTLLAQALAPKVRVVGISPGLTLPSHLQTQSAFEATHRMAPLGRASTPADIARTVLFLLDSPAITGVDLVVDGGQHLAHLERDFSMIQI